MCFRKRTGYLNDYKPKVSETECSSLKSKYDMEIDRKSMWRNKKTILGWAQVFLHSTHSLSVAPNWNSVWTEFCICRASLQVKMAVVFCLHQLLLLSLLYLLKYVLETQISLMNFSLDMNLHQRQRCLSHLALEAGLTLDWIHSKFKRQGVLPMRFVV